MRLPNSISWLSPSLLLLKVHKERWQNWVCNAEIYCSKKRNDNNLRESFVSGNKSVKLKIETKYKRIRKCHPDMYAVAAGPSQECCPVLASQQRKEAVCCQTTLALLVDTAFSRLLVVVSKVCLNTYEWILLSSPPVKHINKIKKYAQRHGVQVPREFSIVGPQKETHKNLEAGNIRCTQNLQRKKEPDNKRELYVFRGVIYMLSKCSWIRQVSNQNLNFS